MGRYESGGGGGGGQPLDSDLTAIAAIATQPFGIGALSAASAAAFRTYIGTVIGTDVQAFDADLTSIAALTTTSIGRSLLAGADAAALRTILAVWVPRVVAAAYAATVTPNADTTDVLNVGALTGALTLANPTGTPVDGQILTVRYLQDATGGRVVTYGAGYAFGTDVTAAMDVTTANAKWERVFQYHSTDAKWRAIGIVRGF